MAKKTNRNTIALLLCIIYFTVILNYDCLPAKASVMNNNLRPIGTGVVIKGADEKIGSYEPSVEYQKIEYKNSLFQIFETDEEKTERKQIRAKVRNFSFILAAFVAAFLLLRNF